MFTQTNLLFLGQKTVKIILIFLAAQLAKKIASLIIKKIRLASEKLGQRISNRQQQRLKTIRSLILNTVKIIINFIALVMALSEIGLDIAPLIAGAGVLGLAVGFGAKTLVSDLIAGFFIIIEDQFNVGDQVELGSSKGKVVRISLRTVTLKDENGHLHLIPNSNIKTVIVKK